MKQLLLLLMFLICTTSFGQYFSNTASKSFKDPVPTIGSLPASGNLPGDIRVEKSSFGMYVWNGTTWLLEATAGGGVVTAVTASGPLFSSGGAVPNITITQSGAASDGYLSSVDWNTFNNKQSALSFGNLTDAGTDGITVTGGAGAVIGAGTSLSQHVADSTHNGYLSSADWSTFNGKQDAISTSSAPAHQFGTGFTSPNTFTYAQPSYSDLSGVPSTNKSVPFVSAGPVLSEDNANFNYDSAGKNLTIGKVKTNYVDPFSRQAIFAYDTNETLLLGSWTADGLPVDSNSEGIVVYGDEALTSTPISAGHGSYARIKDGRFGLFSVESTLPAYAGGAYWYRVDNNQIIYNDNNGAATFSVQRTSGNTVIGGSAQIKSLGAGVVLSDASGNLTSGSVPAANMLALPTNDIYVGNGSNQPAAVVMSGDAAISSSGSVTIANDVNKVYVDFLDGNDASTGSPFRPWKTLQHACSTISPSINRPYTIKISGGNNDSDVGTITCPPNINVVADYVLQISRPVVISGGVSNDSVSFTNITFISSLTWVRNDASVIALTLNNSGLFGALDFEQQGAGVSSTSLFAYGANTVISGATIEAGETIFQGAGLISGTVNYKDSGAAHLLLSGGVDLYNLTLQLNGGITAEFSGDIADTGYSISGTTTGSGTPIIYSDSGSIPPPASITGSYSKTLTSLAPYVSYSPATPGNWSPAPSLVSSALDQLASRVPAVGNLSDAGTDGITITGGSNAVIGSGTSLSQHVADATHNGYLSSADWNTFSAAAGGGVTSISINSSNGFAGSSSGGTTPALTISTTVTGILKGNGTAMSAAVSGTDYQFPISNSSAPAHQFFNSWTAPNTFGSAQPDFSDISGSPSSLQLARTVTTKSANYTILITDEDFLGDASGGAFTLTLPTSASSFSGGKSYSFTITKKDSSANAVIIAGNGADTVLGQANVSLTAQYQSVTLFTDGGGNFYAK